MDRRTELKKRPRSAAKLLVPVMALLLAALVGAGVLYFRLTGGESAQSAVPTPSLAAPEPVQSAPGDAEPGETPLPQSTPYQPVELHLSVDAIDLIGEAVELARLGVLPEGMYRNRAFAEPYVDAGDVELARQDVLYDPQTAGGLLIAVDPADADALYAELQAAVPSAQRIGTVEGYRGGKRIFLR